MTSRCYLGRINLSLQKQNVGDCAKPVYAYIPLGLILRDMDKSIRRSDRNVSDHLSFLTSINIGGLCQGQASCCFAGSMHSIGLHPIVFWINFHLWHHVIEFHILLPNLATILDGCNLLPQPVRSDVARSD
jgi:hypothetical protein